MWRAPLRKFLMGHGAVSGADVNDVAQEVFLRLLRYDRAELIEYPQAYLFKMASNREMQIVAASTKKDGVTVLMFNPGPTLTEHQEYLDGKFEEMLKTSLPWRT